MRALWRHRELSYLELIREMAKFVLDQIDPMADVEPKSGSESRTRYVPTWVRQEVWVRDQGRCTYVDPETGRACESQYALEFDPIFPFAKGGEQTPENLRIACRTHNQLHALHEYGEKKMSQWSNLSDEARLW